MPGPLQKPEQFRRGKRDSGLPGGSTADDSLGLDIQFKILDRPSATIFEKELIQIGSIGAGRYLEISEDGVRMYLAGTLMLDLQNDGDIFVGDTGSGDYVKISAAGVEQWVGGTKLVDVQTGDIIYVGSSSSGEYVKISSSAVELYSGGDKLVDIQSDGDLFIGDQGSGDYVKVSSGGVEQWVDGTKQVDVQTGDVIYVGSSSSSRYVKISSTGIELYSSSERKIHLQSDGDIFIGDDVTSPGQTYFAIFSSGQTYNTEGVSAGDMLIGDNSSSKANIFWDKSTGQLKFRGGKTTELYIDTDGTLTAGDGDVILDSNGLTLMAGSGAPNMVKVKTASDNTIFKIYGTVSASTSQIEIAAEGEDSGDPEALLTMQAITHDGTAHAGAAQIYAQLDTANDTFVASATYLRGFKVCRLTGITTAQRDNLSPVNGMLVYNSTLNKFQGRAGGAWVNLH